MHCKPLPSRDIGNIGNIGNTDDTPGYTWVLGETHMYICPFSNNSLYTQTYEPISKYQTSGPLKAGPEELVEFLDHSQPQMVAA